MFARIVTTVIVGSFLFLGGYSLAFGAAITLTLDDAVFSDGGRAEGWLTVTDCDRCWDITDWEITTTQGLMPVANFFHPGTTLFTGTRYTGANGSSGANPGSSSLADFHFVNGLNALEIDVFLPLGLIEPVIITGASEQVNAPIANGGLTTVARRQLVSGSLHPTPAISFSVSEPSRTAPAAILIGLLVMLCRSRRHMKTSRRCAMRRIPI